MTAILLVAATEAELCGRKGLVCGVGPVEAAATTAAVLASARPDAVLHVGIAGARRDSGLEPLALVVGGEAVYEDLVTTRRLSPTSVAADGRLVEAASKALGGAPVVTIGTTGHVGGSAACPVEAMEGFAVLRACELAAVPAVEVRAISNYVEDERSAWRMDEAIAVVVASLPGLLDALRTAV